MKHQIYSCQKTEHRRRRNRKKERSEVTIKLLASELCSLAYFRTNSVIFCAQTVLKVIGFELKTSERK